MMPENAVFFQTAWSFSRLAISVPMSMSEPSGLCWALKASRGGVRMWEQNCSLPLWTSAELGTAEPLEPLLEELLLLESEPQPMAPAHSSAPATMHNCRPVKSTPSLLDFPDRTDTSSTGLDTTLHAMHAFKTMPQ